MHIFLTIAGIWFLCGICTACYYVYETLEYEEELKIGDIFTFLFIILLGLIGAFFTLKEHFDISCDTVIWRKKKDG